MMVGRDAKTLGLVSLFALSGNIFFGGYNYIMTFEQIVALAIGAFITASVGALVSYIKDLHAKHEEEQADKDRTIQELIDCNKTISKRVDYYEKQFDELRKNMEKISNQINLITYSGMAILRDRIIQSCRVFIERGSVSLVARDNISEMYKWYHELGGNGTGKYYYDELMKLPVDDTPSTPNINYSVIHNSTINAHGGNTEI